MALLRWEEFLSVGVEIIDEDHRLAVDLLNQLDEADDAAFPALFAAFLEHLAEHFGHEEALMDKYRFFAAGVHRAEHVRVLREAQGVMRRLERGQMEMARNYLRQTIAPWFLHHRGAMDVATADFIKQGRG
ncbi:MAG TPA: hemerythrin family protein [Azospirillaceae bacterium]|nr:hemerythrin family protein [Azospirillaceae bacterium]